MSYIYKQEVRLDSFFACFLHIVAKDEGKKTVVKFIPERKKLIELFPTRTKNFPPSLAIQLRTDIMPLQQLIILSSGNPLSLGEAKDSVSVSLASGRCQLLPDRCVLRLLRCLAVLVRSPPIITFHDHTIETH